MRWADPSTMCSSSIFMHIIGNAVAILNSLSIVTANPLFLGVNSSSVITSRPLLGPMGLLLTSSLLSSFHYLFWDQQLPSQCVYLSDNKLCIHFWLLPPISFIAGILIVRVTFYLQSRHYYFRDVALGYCTQNVNDHTHKYMDAHTHTNCLGLLATNTQDETGMLKQTKLKPNQVQSRNNDQMLPPWCMY